MSYGSQSMVDRLRRVMLVEPGPLETSALRAAGWTDVDEAALRAQFVQFRALLEAFGADVVVTGPSPAENPDAIYAYDGVLVTSAGYIALRPCKCNRNAEPAERARELDALGIPRLGGIEAPGFLEGGDTLWLNSRTLAVGLGYRTNAAGATQLAGLLGPLGIEIRTFDLPAYHGPDFCLHLMSLLSLVRPNLAVTYTPLMPVRLLEWLADLEVECLDVTEAEFEQLGTNLLALAPGEVVLVSGCPDVERRLRDRGVVVHSFEGPDLCLAGTGGPTCLTRPLLRGS